MVWPSKCSHESLTNVDHSKGNPRLARRARSVKAEPVARLECFAEASIASIGAGKRCDSATDAEDIRCGGRYFGKCSDDIFPDSELPVHPDIQDHDGQSASSIALYKTSGDIPVLFPEDSPPVK
jgi:hypothetical protein